MGRFARLGTILCLAGVLFLSGALVPAYGVTHDPEVNRKPLKVLVRPLVRKKSDLDPRIDAETLLDFKWENILDNRYLSGHQDDEGLKLFGYSVNSEIGGILHQKRLLTNDPDDMMHLKDYRDRQIYSDIAAVILKPVSEITQGCKSKNPEECNFSGYGQHWLNYNLRAINASRARADNALVELIRSPD